MNRKVETPTAIGTPESNAEREIFAAAATLPAADRPVYLDAACAGRPSMRASLEKLLGRHDGSGFMEGDEEFARLKPDQAGDRIGHYKLLQQIGEGGFGMVWMAEQERPVRRRVALKIIKLGMDTKEVIARFEQERQALAMMDHPNIAKVFDAGATPTGRPFFVMELVRGIQITDYCDQANLPTAERLGLFILICQAVQHAHQKGIIHRDLKPSNVLVTLHDGVPVPKVIDFGVAKATQSARLTDLTLFTRFEQMVGTPLYMSPEQAEMSGLDIDTRSDIHSLGVLLYELLTGRTPFDADTFKKVAFDEMRRLIREQEPPKPSTALDTMARATLTSVAHHRASEPPKLIHTIRGDLDWIVMKALEKDRSRRYATANALSVDIGRFLTGEPVSASPPGAGYRFRKFVKRHKFGVGASFAVLAALVFGLGVSLWQSIEKTRAHRRAVASEQTSREVAGFLKEMLNGVGPSVALGRDTALLKEILDKTAGRIGTDLRGQPEVELELRKTLGEVYRAVAENQKAEAMHRRAIELGRMLYGGNDAKVAESMNNLALVLTDDGKYGEAEKQFREAIDIYRKLRKTPDEDLAASLNNLGMVYRETGTLTKAEAVQRESLAMIRKVHGDGYVKAGYGEINLSIILQLSGRQEEAESSARSSVALFRNIYIKDNPETALALGKLALVLKNGRKLPQAEETAREKSDEAASIHEEALAMRRKLLEPDHPDIVRSLKLLSLLRYRQGHLDDSNRLMKEALEITLRRTGPGHRYLIEIYRHLGFVAESRKRVAEAEALFRNALDCQRKNPGAANSDTADLLECLARTLAAQQNYLESERVDREALATCEAQSDIAPGIPGNIRSQLGAVLLSAGIDTPNGSDADRLARFTEAEMLLTSGLETMRGSETPPARIRVTFESLSRLCTAWNDSFPDPALSMKATGFQQKLRELDAAHPNSR